MVIIQTGENSAAAQFLVEMDHRSDREHAQTPVLHMVVRTVWNRTWAMTQRRDSAIMDLALVSLLFTPSANNWNLPVNILNTLNYYSNDFLMKYFKKYSRKV